MTEESYQIPENLQIVGQSQTQDQVESKVKKQKQTNQRQNSSQNLNNKDKCEQKIIQQPIFQEEVQQNLNTEVKAQPLSNKSSPKENSSQHIRIKEQDEEESFDQDFFMKAKEEKQVSKKEKGEEYSNEMKRKIVLNLLKEKPVQEKYFIHQITSKAHELNIHTYSLKNWINAFKIIFSVEEEIRNSKRKNFSSNEKVEKIEKYFHEYLQYNPKEKYYRVSKVASIIFQVLDISIEKKQKWLNEYLPRSQFQGILCQKERRKQKKKQQYLKRKVHRNERSLIKIESNNEPQQIQFSLELDVLKMSDSDRNQRIRKQQPLKKKIIEEKREKKELQKRKNYQSLFELSQDKSFSQKIESEYPLSFRKNVAKRLDKIIETNIIQTIKIQSEELCLDEESLKKIYDSLGKYGNKIKQQNIVNRVVQQKAKSEHLFFQKQSSHPSEHIIMKTKNNDNSSPSIRINPCGKSYGNLEKLELELIQFYQKSKFIKLKELQRYSLHFLAEVKNYEFHNQRQRLREWIKETLKKYGIYLQCEGI